MHLLTIVRSKWFGAMCYLALSVSLGAFLYFIIVRPDRRYGQLNISCFVFRDLNRNGTYDLGDRPYAGAEVGMKGPNGRSTSARSNIAGFANFTMSLGASDAPVHAPGSHSIHVTPPKNWAITSANADQTAVFRALPESPVGIVTDRVFQPVGVAPDLSLSGSIGNRGGKGFPSLGRLSARSPSGTTEAIGVSQDGRYSFPATVGEWTLDYVPADGGRTAQRKITVKDCAVVVSQLDNGSETTATTPLSRQLGFDTLTPSDTVLEVPNGYGDLDWFGWVAMHQKFPNGPGFVNAACSSEYIAYSSSGHPASVSSNRPFDFVGAKLTMGWEKGEPYEVTVRGWRGSDLVFQDRFHLSSSGPVAFSADYRAITKIEIGSSAYWQVAMDDFEYRLE